MKPVRIVASLILIAASASAQADAIKCRGPDGKVFITDTACPGNNRVDRVQRAETISLDRQLQAARVHAQNSSQLGGIQAEQRAWQEQHRRTAIAATRPVARPPTDDPLPSIRPQREPEPARIQPKQVGNDEYFVKGGGMMRQPPGSDFAYDDKGNAYHKPPGSSFSHGKNGKTCFHYGAFADCK